MKRELEKQLTKKRSYFDGTRLRFMDIRKDYLVEKNAGRPFEDEFQAMHDAFEKMHAAFLECDDLLATIIMVLD